MLIRLFLFTIISLLVESNSAQLSIYYNNKEITDSCSGISSAFGDLPLSDADFKKSFQDLNNRGTWKSSSLSQLRLQNLTESVWIRIQLDSLGAYKNYDFLQINNPHINFLQYRVLVADSVVSSYPLTGDHTKFSTRPIPYNDFLFPIYNKQFSKQIVVIIIDKRNSSLEIPIHLFTTKAMIGFNQKSELFFGFILGMILLIILLQFLLFVFQNDFVYFWYGLFQLCIFLFIGVEHGYLFQYLYPNIERLNDFIRPFTIIICIIPFILFFSLVLDLKENFPKLYTINVRLVISYFLLSIFSVLHSMIGNSITQLFWLQTGSLLSIGLNIVMLSEAIFCYLKKIRFSGNLVLSILGNNIFILIYFLSQNQLLPRQFLYTNAIYFSFLWELSIMTLITVRRYSYFRDEAESLQTKIRQQQESVYKILVDNQEKELQKVSSLLHDSVGANLGLLRLDIENMKLTEEGRIEVANKIASIGNDIRHLSHSLSPLSLHEKGLSKAIEEWVFQINKNTSLSIQYEWVGPVLKFSDKLEVIAFRIVQEMIQNVMKHSKATHAFLQIVVSNQFISIYVEDNGEGIFYNNLKKGVGIRNIEKMMEVLGGSCFIESSQGEGFNISVEFNYSNNEDI
ncbi:MAG: 7TM diverse intracellular signaling domain-containing protein [Chitinophagia bacterium]